MLIVGVDPGTRATGFGAIETDGSSHRLVDCGAVRAKNALPFPQKLQVIHESLRSILVRLEPRIVVVENLFYATNVKSALRLGHVRGVVLQVAVQFGADVVEYSPLEIKQSVVGYGRADKSQVQAMVGHLLSLPDPPEPHDAADALAAALCHANRLRFAQKLDAAASIGAAGRSGRDRVT